MASHNPILEVYYVKVFTELWKCDYLNKGKVGVYVIQHLATAPIYVT